VGRNILINQSTWPILKRKISTKVFFLSNYSYIICTSISQKLSNNFKMINKILKYADIKSAEFEQSTLQIAIKEAY